MSGFLLVCRSICKDKMSFEQQINEVDETENPTPTYNDEQNEHNDVNQALRSKHNGQSYKTFADPTNDGKEKENDFKKGGLAVKPLIEIHSTVRLLDKLRLLSFNYYYTILLYILSTILCF